VNKGHHLCSSGTVDCYKLSETKPIDAIKHGLYKPSKYNGEHRPRQGGRELMKIRVDMLKMLIKSAQARHHVGILW
jgi:hypothetical protein